MKYILMEFFNETDPSPIQKIFCFPNLIAHDEYSEMIQMHYMDFFDRVIPKRAGFIQQINPEEFRFTCSGRSETLDLDSSIHDCTLINNLIEDYSIVKITGMADSYITAFDPNQYAGGCPIDYTFILPNFHDVKAAWDELKYIKIGSGRRWSRSFIDWKVDFSKPPAIINV